MSERIELKPGDKIEFKTYEEMISYMQKLNYEGFVYRQPEPLMIVIDEVPDDLR